MVGKGQALWHYCGVVGGCVFVGFCGAQVEVLGRGEQGELWTVCLFADEVCRGLGLGHEGREKWALGGVVEDPANSGEHSVHSAIHLHAMI